MSTTTHTNVIPASTTSPGMPAIGARLPQDGPAAAEPPQPRFARTSHGAKEGRPVEYEAMIRSMAAGDTRSALTFWRSKHWAGEERARMRRLLSTATEVCMEVAP